MQNTQNMPMYAGILKASTQDFIASVRARFHQTKEVSSKFPSAYFLFYDAYILVKN